MFRICITTLWINTACTTYSHLIEQGNLKKQRCIILQTSESRVNCEYNRG